MSKKNAKKHASRKRVQIHAEVVGPEVETPVADAPTDKPAKEPKVKKPSGLDGAAQVLREAKKAMSAKEIVEAMLAQGLWTTNGKTPTATIYAAMLRESMKLGDKSRFARGEIRGQFCATGNA